MTVPAKAINNVRKPFQEQLAVSIINNNGLSGIAATGNVVDGTGIFKAQGTSHGGGA